MRIIFIVFSLYSFNVFSQVDVAQILPVRHGELWRITDQGMKIHESNLDMNLTKGNGYYMFPFGKKPILQVSTDKDGNTTYMESSNGYEQHILYKFDAQKKLIQFSQCRPLTKQFTGLCYHVNEKICEAVDKFSQGLNYGDIAKCDDIQMRVTTFNHFMNNRHEEENAVLNKEIGKLKDIPNKYNNLGIIPSRSSYAGSANLDSADLAKNKTLGMAAVIDDCDYFRRAGVLPVKKATSKNTKARSGADRQ